MAQTQEIANEQAVADTLLYGIDPFLEKDKAGALSVVTSKILLPSGSTLTCNTFRKEWSLTSPAHLTERYEAEMLSLSVWLKFWNHHLHIVQSDTAWRSILRISTRRCCRY